MTMKRTNDVWGGRTALQLTSFDGVSYRSGLIDQSKTHHYASDLDFIGKKPALRNGAIKSDDVGTLHSVDALFMSNLWQVPMQFSIINGTLSMAYVENVVSGQTSWFNWGDVFARWTWSDMSSRDWQRVIDGE